MAVEVERKQRMEKRREVTEKVGNGELILKFT